MSTDRFLSGLHKVQAAERREVALPQMGPEVNEAVTKVDELRSAVSLASSPCGTVITLKRVQEDLNPTILEDTASPPFNGHAKKRHRKRQADCSSDDELNLARALRRRPWINYYESETSSDDESDVELVHPAARSSTLPVGVLRGCPSCNSCQKVLARWRPEAGCRPSLDEAPVFFPLEEEFRDTMKYIASISAEAEPYGICRIVPPQSWQPPCPLRDFEKQQTLQLPTRVQQVHKLQVRQPQNKSCSQLKKRRRGRPLRMGGLMGRRSLLFPDGNRGVRCQSPEEDDNFGFDPGPDFTIGAFEKYANQFKEDYFGILDANQNPESVSLSNDSKKRWEPSVENIEGEYWRVVEHATEKIEVLYGADIETGEFGSGFPKAKPGTEVTTYEQSGWNLNNIARLPGSVLAFEEGDISGVLIPWLYVGMCFSSFCWHVEDHHFYSLNYMHWGAPKVWYGVPSHAASKLEEAMKKHLPDLFEEQPDLLHKLVTQLSPSVLKAEGVPVYRAVQRPGEFVVTFPRAYHAGFNCGFNCAEAVNVAPVDWLPHGQNAVELYREQRRKTSVSHDKLLLGAAKQALTILQGMKEGRFNDRSLSGWQKLCEQNGVLAKALKKRVDMEHRRRLGLLNLVHIRRMDSIFGVLNERECFICHYDLHSSAVGCECSPNRFACLEHAELLCACGQTKKFVLYRYDSFELDSIVAALEGQATACNSLLTREKVFSFESPPVFGKQYLHEHYSPMLSTWRGLQNQDRPAFTWAQFDSLSKPSIDPPNFGVRDDRMRFGVVDAGYLLNQQLHESQRLSRQTLQDCINFQQGSSEINGFSEELTVDLEQERVAEPNSLRYAVSGILTDKILMRQRPEISTTQLLLTSDRDLKSSTLKISDCPADRMLEEDSLCETQQKVEQGFYATQGTVQPLCSNSKPLNGWELSVKMDRELIVLSDDDEDNYSPAKAAGCGHGTDANGRIATELSNNRAPGHGLSSKRVSILTLKQQDLINQYEGQCRSPSRDDTGQVRLTWNAGAVEPLLHFEYAGIGKELSEGPRGLSWGQAGDCSFPVGKHINSQEFWKTSTDHAEYHLSSTKHYREHETCWTPDMKQVPSAEKTSTDHAECHPSSTKPYREHETCWMPDMKQVPSDEKRMLGYSSSLHSYPLALQSKNLGCEVELLDSGRLVLGKAWSNKHAIFPAGGLGICDIP